MVTKVDDAHIGINDATHGNHDDAERPGWQFLALVIALAVFACIA
ncbi:MAG: hypothetical protein ABI593_00885 [Betaproteobacteria bacterium]